MNLTTFALDEICGAGPTGVEVAGAIAELAHSGVAKDFRNSTPRPPAFFWCRLGRGYCPSSTNGCRPSRADRWRRLASRCASTVVSS